MQLAIQVHLQYFNPWGDCRAASVARPIIGVYSRFCYICIYIYVCLHVHCTRPCTPFASHITSAHCALSFGTLAAVRSTTLRSHPFARYGWRRQFSCRQPRRWQQLKPVYSYQIQEAPGRRQRLKPYACVQLPDTGSGQTTTATWVVRVQLPDTGSAAQARLQHRGKNDWQPNGIFLSLYFFIFILFFMFISISF